MSTVPMFGSLKAIVSRLLEGARSQDRFENKECRLATAALLLRVATVECEMSQARWAKLYAVLKSGFGLDDRATAQLIEDAVAADRSAIDLYHFTRQLNVLDDEGRSGVVKMMWEIVYADGSVSEFEANLIWRVADMLGVSARQRIELRRRVADEAPSRRLSTLQDRRRGGDSLCGDIRALPGRTE
jgi:uncharacterized tellurite resistance protein B-like protein